MSPSDSALLWRLLPVAIIAFLAAAVLAASVRKFMTHRPQRAFVECLSEHHSLCIGDGAVQRWGTAQAKWPDRFDYSVRGRI